MVVSEEGVVDAENDEAQTDNRKNKAKETKMKR